MKHKPFCTLGLVLLGVLAIAVIYAWAATTAPGPYYALPSWDQTLPTDTRFIVLSNMSSAAVLDRETGLVWEASPSTSGITWANAQIHCNLLDTGNRKGWRLPTIQELASLVDPTRTVPALPVGHPFQHVLSANYWSATTSVADDDDAWNVSFQGGGVGHASKFIDFFLVWCVRGGQGVDPQ